MLTHKLVESIEIHWEQLTAKLIHTVRQDPKLEHVGKLPESELKEWCRRFVQNLGHWLGGDLEALAPRYEEMGKTRFEQGVPLHEAVHCLHILKEAILDFARERGLGGSTLEIYAEEELEYKIGRSFDRLTYHLVHGYESAMHAAARRNARAAVATKEA